MVPGQQSRDKVVGCARRQALQLHLSAAWYNTCIMRALLTCRAALLCMVDWAWVRVLGRQCTDSGTPLGQTSLLLGRAGQPCQKVFGAGQHKGRPQGRAALRARMGGPCNPTCVPKRFILGLLSCSRALMALGGTSNRRRAQAHNTWEVSRGSKWGVARWTAFIK